MYTNKIMISKTATILVKILNQKLKEISKRKKQIPLSELKTKINNQNKSRGFIKAIQKKINQNKIAVIAEIKQASPSKGIIKNQFITKNVAQDYTTAGATCLSVLTDKFFFNGNENNLIETRHACELPILRKDFIIDEYQIYETRVLGADCILLIVAAFNGQYKKLYQLHDLANKLGMDVLIEVHNKNELDIVHKMNLKIIGINNRNLHFFNTNLNNTIKLIENIKNNQIIVTESGIHTHQNIHFFKKHNITTFLIGEALMKKNIPENELKNLFLYH